MFTTRRSFIASAAASLGMSVFHETLAQSASTIVGVSWGGAQVDGAKAIAAEWLKGRRDYRMAWEVHEGSSSAVATKIRSTWPEVKLHLCHVNDPAIHIMRREGWLEPVNDLPNLKDAHPRFVLRDAAGNALAVPHYASTVCWGYRQDLVDRPIGSLEELLDPRFKGRVGLRDPSSFSGLILVAFALEAGGDEKRIDPAFDILARLARTGNVVNVAKGNADVVNSLNLGKSSIAMAGLAEWSVVARNHPVKLLAKVPGSRALKSFYSLAHWAIPKSSVSAGAADLANYFLSPERQTQYAKHIGTAPANRLATYDDPLGALLKEDEFERFGYFCDFDYMSQNVQKWIERFDLEVRPLLRRS